MTGDGRAPVNAGRPDLDVESLLAVLEELPDARLREAALDLLEALMGLHRTGLARMLDVVKAHPAGEAILRAFGEDPVIASVLTSHDLATPGSDLEGRVRSALEKVRPYMHGHGGDVELVEVRDGRVSLRLAGACHGCGFSEDTLRRGIEQILRLEVPEVREIVVSGTFETPEPRGSVAS